MIKMFSHGWELPHCAKNSTRVGFPLLNSGEYHPWSEGGCPEKRPNVGEEYPDTGVEVTTPEDQAERGTGKMRWWGRSKVFIDWKGIGGGGRGLVWACDHKIMNLESLGTYFRYLFIDYLEHYLIFKM